MRGCPLGGCRSDYPCARFGKFYVFITRIIARRGLRNAGRVPFGYKADPLSHQLVVQPAEAPVVKRMFEMAAAGAPPSAIAMWINGYALRFL